MKIIRRDMTIEPLMKKGQWKAAQAAIEKELAQFPNSHWLWSRLSSAKYEQRDYKGALAAAEKALELMPDCPLALWDHAGALHMLGETEQAQDIYTQLHRRGLEQLKNPDADAEECWEGPGWTRDLVADCAKKLEEHQ